MSILQITDTTADLFFSCIDGVLSRAVGEIRRGIAFGGGALSLGPSSLRASVHFRHA